MARAFPGFKTLITQSAHRRQVSAPTPAAAPRMLSLLGSTGNETRIIAADTSTATATVFPELSEILQVSAWGQSRTAHLLHLPLRGLLATQPSWPQTPEWVTLHPATLSCRNF